MEIKENEYIRTTDGIFKVTKIDGLYIYLDKEYFDNQYQMMRDVTFKERIVKHSFNIKELIEEGDIVNGQIVYKKEEGLAVERAEHIIPYELIEEMEIEEILTHEQYERNCYTVKEEE